MNLFDALENSELNGRAWVYERITSKSFHLYKDVTKIRSRYAELRMKFSSVLNFKKYDVVECEIWCSTVYLHLVKTYLTKIFGIFLREKEILVYI